MTKIECKTTCVTSKGLFKRGQTYEVPEADLALFSPDYIRVLPAENKPKIAPETREKKAAKKTTRAKK